MRVDIPFQMFFKSMYNSNILHKYSITDIYYITFTNDGEWYLLDDRLMQCLYGPCYYAHEIDGIGFKYKYSVPWIDKLIPVEDWLKEIEKILEGKR